MEIGIGARQNKTKIQSIHFNESHIALIKPNEIIFSHDIVNNNNNNNNNNRGKQHKKDNYEPDGRLAIFESNNNNNNNNNHIGFDIKIKEILEQNNELMGYGIKFGILFIKQGSYNKNKFLNNDIKIFRYNSRQGELIHNKLYNLLKLQNKFDLQSCFIKYLEEKKVNTRSMFTSFATKLVAATVTMDEWLVSIRKNGDESLIRLKHKNKTGKNDSISVRYNKEMNAIYFMKNGTFVNDSIRFFNIDLTRYDCYYGLTTIGCSRVEFEFE